MPGKSIKPRYGPAKYGESLIVGCVVSDKALILPSYLPRVFRIKDDCATRAINHAHEVPTKSNASIRNNA
ncbi:hypothetical protein ESP60_02905 [Anaplasma phagocytophilum]|nr:hypothetical protein ESP60_02905 [Anaplasma phagocytophilum]